MHIQTERLTLHPFADEDILPLQELLMNETVAKTYMLPIFKSPEEAYALAKRLQVLSISEKKIVLGVYMQARLIGIFNEVEMQDDRVELGYAIHPDHHNQGFATEALRALILHFFQNGFSEVKTGAFSTNLASIRVMEKAGMKKTQSKASVNYAGKIHHCVYYSIKKEDVL